MSSEKEAVEKAHSGTMGIDHITTKGAEQDIAITSDAKVSVETGIQQVAIATGANFLFHEFGAGVKYNSPRRMAKRSSGSSSRRHITYWTIWE